MRSLATVFEEQLTLWLAIPQDRDDLRQHLQRIINDVRLYEINVMGKTIDLRQVSSDATKGSQDIVRMLGFTKDEWQKLELNEKIRITTEIKKAFTEKLTEVKSRFFGEMVLSRLNFAWENVSEDFVVTSKSRKIYHVYIGPPSIECEIALKDDLTFALNFYEKPRFYISVGYLHPQLLTLYYTEAISVYIKSNNILDAVEEAAAKLEREIGAGDGSSPPRWASILVLLMSNLRGYGEKKFESTLEQLYLPPKPALSLATYPKVKANTQRSIVEVTVESEHTTELPFLFPSDEEGYKIHLSATVRFDKQRANTISITATASFQISSAAIYAPKRKAQSSKAVALNVGNKKVGEVVDAIFRQLDNLIDTATKEIKTVAPFQALRLLFFYIGYLGFHHLVERTDTAIGPVLVHALRPYIPSLSLDDITISVPIRKERGTGQIVAPVYANMFKHDAHLSIILTLTAPKIHVGENRASLILSADKVEIKSEFRGKRQRIEVEPSIAFYFVVSNSDTSEKAKERFLTAFAEFVAKSVEWVLREHMSDLVGIREGEQAPSGRRK